MLTPYNQTAVFFPVIKKLLPAYTALGYVSREMVLRSEFLIYENNYSVFYAPHNDDYNPSAEIIMIGITPGWSQSKLAYETVLSQLQVDPSASYETLCRQAKLSSRFAGQMRTNLIHMIDQLPLAERLSIPEVSWLFRTDCPLLHTTSLIKYPVFLHKGGSFVNYSGYSPSLLTDDYLQHFICQSLSSELAMIPHIKMIIPLGNIVERALLTLFPEYSDRVLCGLPHPSGLNAHRISAFEHQKADLIQQVRRILN